MNICVKPQRKQRPSVDGRHFKRTQRAVPGSGVTTIESMTIGILGLQTFVHHNVTPHFDLQCDMDIEYRSINWKKAVAR